MGHDRPIPPVDSMSALPPKTDQIAAQQLSRYVSWVRGVCRDLVHKRFVLTTWIIRIQDSQAGLNLETRGLSSVRQAVRLALTPHRVPAVSNRARRLASVRHNSIRTMRQIVYSPGNHRYWSRGWAAIAAAQVQTRAAILSPGVQSRPETAHGKPHSFRRRVRYKSGRLIRCFSPIACIRHRRRVASAAPPVRF
jgi:hypothetical protein